MVHKISILFVCMGNICRSPTAEAVFRARVVARALADVIEIDSAGTIDYHEGNPPDRRAQAAAKARGYDLSDQRARQVTEEDCHRFDYLIAMDGDNLRNLETLCPQQGNSYRFLDFAPNLGVRDVPDPYYGGEQGFEHVLELIEAASDGLLTHLIEHHPELAS